MQSLSAHGRHYNAKTTWDEIPLGDNKKPDGFNENGIGADHLMTLEEYLAQNNRLEGEAFNRAIRLGIHKLNDDVSDNQDGLFLTPNCCLYPLIRHSDLAFRFVEERKTKYTIRLAPYAAWNTVHDEYHTVLLAVQGGRSMMFHSKYNAYPDVVPVESMQSLDWQHLTDDHSSGFFVFHMLEQICSSAKPIRSLEELSDFLQSVKAHDITKIKEKVIELDAISTLPESVSRRHEVITQDRPATNVALSWWPTARWLTRFFSENEHDSQSNNGRDSNTAS
jgi:hypothetical protein